MHEAEVNSHKLSSAVQSSAMVWPNDQKFRDELSIPLSLTLHPLEHIGTNIDCSFSGGRINDYRCHSCKAFANKFCVIRSKYQYDCSICGCTNRTKIELNSLASQFTLPVYTCLAKSQSFQQIKDNVRTFVFAIDVSSYMEETATIVRYVINIIKDFLKLVRQEHQKADTENRKTGRIQIIIMGFNDHLTLYRVIKSTEAPSQPLLEQKEMQVAFRDHKQTEAIQTVQIQKIVDTHLGMNHDDLVKDHNSFFIEVPKHEEQVENILLDLIESVKASRERHNSNALLPAVQRIMHYTRNCMGKVYIITGFRDSRGPLVSKIQQQPEQFRSNLHLNRQKCLNQTLLYLLQRTQMSVSIFIYNTTFTNLLPLYAIAKMTNGQLKHYNPHNHHQLYYELYYSICSESFQLGTEAVLKVRHSAGIKLIGMFGQYRPYKGTKDQVELLSCSPTRLYMFEFIVEGKIQQPYINIQLSILWTDIQGNRVFKIITHSQKLSGKRAQILDSINYGVVNQSYLWAVIHNMDNGVRVKNLQVTLQERCRKHLQALEKYQEPKPDTIKKSTPYVIFSYYLISHFIMNTRYGADRVYDKSIESRSRIITSDVSGLYAIWPVVYSISKNKIKIVQLKFSQIRGAEIAVVIDQNDFCYVYIVDEATRRDIMQKKIDQNRLLSDIISQTNGLQPLGGVLKQIRQQKPCGYTEIILLQSLQGAYVLDEKGSKGYLNFVTNLVT